MNTKPAPAGLATQVRVLEAHIAAVTVEHQAKSLRLLDESTPLDDEAREALTAELAALEAEVADSTTRVARVKAAIVEATRQEVAAGQAATRGAHVGVCKRIQRMSDDIPPAMVEVVQAIEKIGPPLARLVSLVKARQSLVGATLTQRMGWQRTSNSAAAIAANQTADYVANPLLSALLASGLGTEPRLPGVTVSEPTPFSTGAYGVEATNDRLQQLSKVIADELAQVAP